MLASSSATSCGPMCTGGGEGGSQLHRNDPKVEAQWAEMNQIMYSWAKIMVAIND